MEELKEGIKNKNKADKIERAVVAGGVGAVAGGVAGGVAGAGVGAVPGAAGGAGIFAGAYYWIASWKDYLISD